MRAIFAADTHFLWYVAGRANSGLRKPRIDYRALRNQVADFLIKRYGNVYDLECYAFVVNRKQHDMTRFIDLLEGFGFEVSECRNATANIIEFLNSNYWDLVALADGSIETMVTASKVREDGRRVVSVGFEKEKNELVDCSLVIDQKVLYEAYH